MSKKGYCLILILAIVAGFIGGTVSDPLVNRLDLELGKSTMSMAEFSVSTGGGLPAIKVNTKTGRAWILQVDKPGRYYWKTILDRKEVKELIRKEQKDWWKEQEKGKK